MYYVEFRGRPDVGPREEEKATDNYYIFIVMVYTYSSILN